MSLAKNFGSVMGKSRKNDLVIENSIEAAHVELPIYDRINSARDGVGRL